MASHSLKPERSAFRGLLNLLTVGLDTLDGIEEGKHPLDALHGAWKESPLGKEREAKKLPRIIVEGVGKSSRKKQ